MIHLLWPSLISKPLIAKRCNFSDVSNDIDLWSYTHFLELRWRTALYLSSFYLLFGLCRVFVMDFIDFVALVADLVSIGF